MQRDSVFFTLNGELIELKGDEVFSPLSDILRYKLQLTGTKVVCAEGDCGACTVMVARSNPSPGQDSRFRSLNSCILTGFLADGLHIVTIEGLKENQKLNEIQKSMIDNFGAQCGFCTPGFIMSIANMFEHKEEPSIQNIKNYLTGNLCRCTGYQQIIEAVQNIDTKKLKLISNLYSINSLGIKLNQQTQNDVLIKSENKIFYAPTNLKKALEFKNEHPKARIFSGATDLGVQINKGRKIEPHQLSLHLINELYKIQKINNCIEVGAKVSIDMFQNFIADILPEFSEFLNIFASPQIKNSATLIGNLANGSPIADTTSTLFSLEALVIVESIDGRREIPVTQFFKGYKIFDLKENELITKIIIPLPHKNSVRGIYKISQRRDLDISAVNASFAMTMDGKKISTSRIAYGGVAPTPIRLYKIENYLKDKELNKETITQVLNMIPQEINPISDIRGSREFRLKLAQKLFEKYIQEKHS